MRELVRRYGRWQLRDYFTERGVWTLLAGLAALTVFWLNYDRQPPRYLTEATESTSYTGTIGTAGGPPGAPPQRVQVPSREEQLAAWWRAEPRRFHDSVLAMFMIVGFAGTLLATHGIVARDRERGYHRFLFSKPVGMVGYYAQSFVVSGVGLLAVSAGLLGATAVAFGRSVPVGALGIVASEFVLLGGTVFLLSTLWRFDFVLAALSWPAAALVGSLAHSYRHPLLAVALEPLLPPVLRLGEMYKVVAFDPGPVAPLDFVVVLGYGAVAFGLGLVVLSRRAAAA